MKALHLIKTSFPLLAFIFGMTSLSAAYAQETISKIEDIHGGVVVILHGTVDEIIDNNEFYLKDSTGRVRIFVGEDNEIKTSVGETLTVFGFSSHQSVHAIAQKITANTILRADGSEINFTDPDKSSEPTKKPRQLIPLPKWKVLPGAK
jgi:outer membrane lipoprotein-sorting protein